MYRGCHCRDFGDRAEMAVMRRGDRIVKEPTVVIIHMCDIMVFLLVFFMISTIYMVLIIKNTNKKSMMSIMGMITTVGSFSMR